MAIAAAAGSRLIRMPKTRGGYGGARSAPGQRDNRAQQTDGEAEQQETLAGAGVCPLRRSTARRERAHRPRWRWRAPRVRASACRSRAEQDVARPGHAGQQGERDADRTPRGEPEQRHPTPARSTQIRSRGRRDPAMATASGPRNSMVTAMPSGIRANDW